MHHIFLGTKICDKGYMGVGLVAPSLEEEYGTYDTMLKIMIPQGAKGLYVDLISCRSSEQEIILARDSVLKVLLRYRCKGKRIFVCRLIEN